MGAPSLVPIQDAGSTVTIENLSKPRVFKMSACTMPGAQPTPICDRAAVIGTEVHISHETLLKLCRLRWFVSAQDVSETPLGHPILEALGIDTNKVSTAAAEKYSGSVYADALDINGSNYGSGRASRFLEGVLHMDDAENDDEGHQTGMTSGLKRT